MRRHLALAAFALAAVALGGMPARSAAECPRTAPGNPEAITLANDGDKVRATDLDAAIAKYKQASELDPSNHRIVWKLVLAYFKKEAWQDTSEAAARACKLAPKNASYSFMHGNALQHLQRWDEARAPLEKAIALDPGHADAHFELAEVLLRLRDEKGALEHYTKAIERKPDEAVFYGSLADLYLRLGYLDHAEQTLKTGIALVPNEEKRFPLHSLAGNARDERGDVAGAVKHYEDAKRACGQCSGHQAIAFFNLGAAYATLRPPRKNEAVQQLTTFNKMVCKGAAAKRYADQCAQAQALIFKMGGNLP